jgi:phage terminase large subunit GpA-like protein
VVPDAVRCLFATVDVNKTWFEVLVMGLASEGELWTVDHFKVLVSVDALGQEHQVDPARRAADWDLLTRLLVTRAYPLAGDPSCGMRLRGLMVDSHGEAGVTRQAYNWWRRLRDAHDEDGQRAPLARREGEIDGRDVWTVALSRGLGGLNQPRLAVTYPDSGRRDRRAGGAGDVPVAQFNPTLFKNDAAGMLNQLEPGSGFIHFSNDLLTWDPETGEATAPHPFFDQLAAEAPDKTGRWLPVKEGIRNESWDLLVLTLVQMHLWGVRKYDWNNPPVWCRPADENPLVVPIGAPLERFRIIRDRIL